MARIIKLGFGQKSFIDSPNFVKIRQLEEKVPKVIFHIPFFSFLSKHEKNASKQTQK